MISILYSTSNYSYSNRKPYSTLSKRQKDKVGNIENDPLFKVWKFVEVQLLWCQIMEKSKIKGLEMKVVGAKLIQFKNLFLFFSCFQIFTLQKGKRRWWHYSSTWQNRKVSDTKNMIAKKREEISRAFLGNERLRDNQVLVYSLKSISRKTHFFR